MRNLSVQLKKHRSNDANNLTLNRQQKVYNRTRRTGLLQRFVCATLHLNNIQVRDFITHKVKKKGTQTHKHILKCMHAYIHVTRALAEHNDLAHIDALSY